MWRKIPIVTVIHRSTHVCEANVKSGNDKKYYG